MKTLFHISACLFAAAILLSCTKESYKETWTKQETYIENFLTNQQNANEDYYVVSNSGSERLVVAEGSGEELAKDGTVSFYYAGYVLTGASVSNSNLFATNREATADAASWSVTDSTAYQICTVKLSESGFVEGLKNGLLGVKGGEECYILFSGQYGFGKRALGTIPANSALAYHIWVESISNE